MPSPYYKVLPLGLLPEQVPIPFYERHSFRLSIYLLLQFGFLVFLLASQSAAASNDEGNNQQGNNDQNLGQPEHRIQHKNIPDDWPKCVIPAKVNDKANSTNYSRIVDIKCAEKIPNFIRDKDIQKISKEGEFRSLSMCWQTAYDKGIKFSSRYKWNNSPNSFDACSKLFANLDNINDEENTEIHGIELKWKHQILILLTTFNDWTTDITSIVNDKFNGRIDKFLHCLLTHNCSKDKAFHSFDGNANAGAMLADYSLDAIHLDLSKQLRKLDIFWDLIEPKGKELDNLTREILLEECEKEVIEMNKRANFPWHVWNEESKKECLMSPKEWAARMGIDERINPNPEGKNQSWGGPNSSGPIEPIPLRPTRPDEWNSHSKVTFNFTGVSGRNKRDTINFDVECDFEEFDLRKAPEFEKCAKVIGYIRDQDTCGFCWAVSTAGALTDRACITGVKKGMINKRGEHSGEMIDKYGHASARDLAECTYNEPKKCCDGCRDGGWPSHAWKYSSINGTVNEICKPYPTNNPRKDWKEKCHFQCDKTNGYGLMDVLGWGYHKDKANDSDGRIWYKSAGALYSVGEYRIVKGTNMEQAMMDEIRNNGSVVAGFTIYTDFRTANRQLPYSPGPNATERGLHAVRLIGFGEMKCTGGLSGKYWLAANSWGADWSDFNGLFRIVRGSDSKKMDIEKLEVSWGSVIRRNLIEWFKEKE